MQISYIVVQYFGKKLCKKAKNQVFANNFNRLAFLKLCNRDYKIVSSIDAPSVASMPPDWTRPKSVTLSLFFSDVHGRPFFIPHPEQSSGGDGVGAAQTKVRRRPAVRP